MDDTKIVISEDNAPSKAAVDNESAGVAEHKEDFHPSEPTDAIPIEAMTHGSNAFVFEAASKSLKSLEDREMRLSWQKWDLESRRCVRTVRFNKKFDPAEAQSFLIDLFNSPALIDVGFHAFSTSGAAQALPKAVVAVEYHSVPATITSMEFFDRIETAGITTGESQYIRKQLDEVVDGVTISDHLKDALVNPDSAYSSRLYSEDERREFLYRLLKMVVTGGSMCQYEDEAKPYFECTKQLYKDLLVVGKDTHTGKIVVQSYVYAIDAMRVDVGGKLEKVQVFPHDNPHSVFWVCVDPIHRLATLFYNAWVPFW